MDVEQAMARQILLILGHPDPSETTFCGALASAYARGAEASGFDVRQIRVGALDLPYVRNSAEWRAPAKGPEIRAAQERFIQADHLVFVYPLWLGDMPAKLKSFLEHVSCGGSIIDLDAKGGWRKKLNGKSARIIVTMGMPALAYRWYYLSHSLRSFARNILAFSGVAPIRKTIIGTVEGSSDERAAWLARVQALGEKGG